MDWVMFGVMAGSIGTGALAVYAVMRKRMLDLQWELRFARFRGANGPWSDSGRA